MNAKTLHSLGATFVLPLACAFPGHAATAVWFDGFDVAGNTMNINQDLATRQGGAPAPISYLTNTTVPSNDYHHQMFAPSSPLQLAGDAGVGVFDPNPALSSIGLALVSPNYNFTGASGGGILGKQITFSLDVGAFIGGNSNSYTWSSITIGSNAPVAGSGTNNAGFSARFVEDRFADPLNPAYFIQFLDGPNIIMASALNPAANGWMNVVIDIDDTLDGNPWNGSGNTTIGVSVNNNAIGTPFTKVGGYSNNYITLEGASNSNGFGLATHLFDNLTVYTAPVPEPSVALLGGFSLLGMLRRRRA